MLFHLNAEKLDRQHKIKASSGVIDTSRFVYFFYYLGLYPVAPESKITLTRRNNLEWEQLEPEVFLNLDYSEEGARKYFYEHPEKLRMELRYTIRFGEAGKIFLYMLSAYLNNTPKEPNIRYTNELFFIISLLLVFIAFWWIRQPVLGLLFVILMGSNPVQLYEVYLDANVLGWQITTALIILALHLPVLTNRRLSKYYLWSLPILTGVILATIRQIRTEPIAIIASVVFSYFLISRTNWRIKGAMIFLLFLSFTGVSRGWKAYFDYKFEEASQKVKEAGGTPYTGPRMMNHFIWHPIWCGLGDFDRKYGYSWADGAGVEYAFPILNEKYKMGLPDLDSDKWGHGRYTLKEYYDNDQKYRKTIFDGPEYTEVVRDKVIYDITHDPLWYFDIILKRLWRVIDETSPMRFSLGRWWLDLPMHGLALFPVLLVLLATRSWMLIKFICFTLPLSFTSILIYSGGNTPFYSCYHLAVGAVLGAWLIEGGLWWYKSRKRIAR